MAEFLLPAASRPQPGKTFKAPDGAKRIKAFKIYRWDPEVGGNPRLDTYEIELDACGPMVLDALIKIKNEVDSTLTFRRSCREGVCGSCSMNIDGSNTLACTMYISDVPGEVRIYPLPHMDVIKDLVPDLTHIFAQYQSIEPWLKTETPPPERERPQSPASAPSSTGSGMHPLLLLLDRLSQLLVERDRYLGPAILLQAYRWIVDSRDESTGERLDQLEDPFRLYRCHTIMNCTKPAPRVSIRRRRSPRSRS